MGELIYFINHNKKEWFCPISKMGEIYINRKLMCGILYIFKNEWNNNKIEILSELDREMENVWKNYKEKKIDWNDFDDF